MALCNLLATVGFWENVYMSQWDGAREGQKLQAAAMENEVKERH